MYVYPLQKHLNPETLAPYGLDVAGILFIDYGHDLIYRLRGCATQFVEAYVDSTTAGIVLRAILWIAPHFDIELSRLLDVPGEEGIKASVRRDYAKIRFAREIVHGGFDPQHVFRTLGFPGDQVGASEIDIGNRCREKDMYRFVVSNIHSIGLDYMAA